MTSKDEIILGIDLGTCNSCAAVWRNNSLEIIPDHFGKRTIPSVIAFTNNDKYIGREAKNQIDINPYNTFYDVKRFIGRKFSDDSVQNDLNFVNYEILNSNDDIVINCPSRNKTFSPEEISAMVLREIKFMAENYLNTKVTKTVVTIPAYFNDGQRQATKDAIQIAGLECIRLINEPTSAAIAYGLFNTKLSDDINVIVYDLGGGTLDISLLNISNGVFQVLISTGNTHLGGLDFDYRIFNFCLEEFKKINNIVTNDFNPFHLQKLKKLAEAAKIKLSSTDKATIFFEKFYNDIDLNVTITEIIFQNICNDLFALCIDPLHELFNESQIPKEQVNEILLVGGATKMPILRNFIKLFFSGKELNISLNPDEVVAAGAALQGYMLVNDNSPFSQNMVLLDITPLSLGVETFGGIMNVLIPRNSVIPIKRKKKYTTDQDYETSVAIKIFEGERAMTKDNFKVGEFLLENIKPMLRGLPEIEITFAIDVNGIISVQAEDLLDSKNSSCIKFNCNKNRLSREKINQLIEEAKAMELLDKIDREKKHFQQEIIFLCHNIQSNLNDPNFKISNEDKKLILNDIEQINKWISECDYSSRERSEFCNIIDRLKNKFGTLIFPNQKNENSIKPAQINNIVSCNLFNDDDDNDLNKEIYHTLSNKKISPNEIDKKISLREQLLSLCSYILYQLDSKEINFKNNLLEEFDCFRNFVDDTILWIHVKENITLPELEQKIILTKKMQEELINKFESIQNINELDSLIKLEDFCLSLLSIFQENNLPISTNNLTNLKVMIEDTIVWINQIKTSFSMIENFKPDFDLNKTCLDKINEINDVCSSYYSHQYVHNINIQILENNEYPSNGTTISHLKTN